MGTQKLSCPSSGEPGAVNWASAVQWDKPLPYVFGVCRTSGESSSHQPQEQALQPCLFYGEERGPWVFSKLSWNSECKGMAPSRPGSGL